VLSAGPFSSVGGGEEDPMAKYMSKFLDFNDAPSFLDKSVMDGDAFMLPSILGCAKTGST
jgi:hypothetical protein